MFISTLPPPKHTLLCQESSGQIFKCTYIVDKLSNGNKVVSITVYVPANFVASGTESFRVVKVRVTVSVHTTYSCQTGYHDVVIDGIHECVPNPPEHTPEYLIGLKYGTMDGQIGIYDLAAACGKYHGTEFVHCSFGYRTAYVTNCLNSKFGCGDGPTILPGQIMQQEKVMNNLTNTSILAAKKKPGAICGGGNCTMPLQGTPGSGARFLCPDGSQPVQGSCPTPPPVDCTKNPNDPSCTQTLTPSTTTPPSTPSTPTPPPSSSTPPPSNNPSPPSNNNPPPSSDNGNGGSGTIPTAPAP
jgi:hypothetical protein